MRKTIKPTFKVWDKVKDTCFEVFTNYTIIERITVNKKLSGSKIIQYHLRWTSINFYEWDVGKILFKPTKQELNLYFN